MGKKVNIKINADSKNAQSGIDKTTKSLNKLTKSINNSSIGKFSKAFTPLGQSLGMIKKAITTVVATVNDLNNAYLKQAKAEKQLEVAAKNNPYLNRQSVTELKNFASELQNIGTIGDEELLPLMAELASSGRTQAEIQNIMSAALDMSASGIMSMDSAVTALNKTYSGSAGQLTKYSAKLNTLTKEQLQNGEAVKVIAEQYKGMAQEMGKLSAAEKFKNAWGDFKENLGQVFSRAIGPVQNFSANVIGGWNDAIKKKKEYENTLKDFKTSKENVKNGNGTEEDFNLLIKNENVKIEQNKARIEEIKKGWLEIYKTEAEARKVEKSDVAEIEGIEKNISKIVRYKTTLENQLAELKNKELQRQKEEERLVNDAKAKDAIKKYKETLEKQRQLREQNRAILKTTQEQELEDEISTMQSALITALSEADGNITQNNPFYKAEVESIENLIEKLEQLKGVKKEVADTPSTDNTFNADVISKWLPQKDEIQVLKDELKELQELAKNGIPKDATDEMKEAFNQIAAAIENCEKELEQLKFEKVISDVQLVANTVVSSMQTLMNSISNIQKIALQKNEKTSQKELDNLKEEWEEGKLKYEEYQEKKTQVDKKAAQEEYKIRMAQWRMNLAMAMAQSAQAVLNALASGTPPTNIINASAAGLIGLTNVATVAGNKPIPPSFATGGFLTGNSYHGDKIPFKGNAGEAILNPAEQRMFMNMANGNFKGGANVSVSMPVKIENNASNDVSVSATNYERDIVITINKIVDKGFKNGSFTTGMNIANAKSQGVRVL